MKKQLSIIVGCLVMTAGLVFSQSSPTVVDPNVTFSFDDGVGTPNAGTYSPTATITLTIFGTFSGFNANGFSMWLETNTALAPFLTITNESFSGATWTDPNDNPNDYDVGFSPFPKAFNDTAGRTNAGFLTSKDTQGTDGSTAPRTGDLGATGGSRAPNTYQMATLTLQLTGAPAGTYTLATTLASPKGTSLGDTTFVSHVPAVQGVYTITVVPEPATWSLMGLGGLGAFGLTWLRARRK